MNKRELFQRLTQNRRQSAVSPCEIRQYENSKLVETDDKMIEKLIDFSLNTADKLSPKNRAKSAFDRQRNSAGTYRTLKNRNDENIISGRNKIHTNPLSPQHSEGKFDFNSLNETLNLTATDKSVIHKLSYEWKNIYRNCLKIDSEGTDLIDISYFDNVCQKFKVNFNKEELKRLQKLFQERP